MTQPGSGMSAAHAAGDVQLKIYTGGGDTLTDAEARAWLAQTVPPDGSVARTIDAKEVPGA